MSLSSTPRTVLISGVSSTPSFSIRETCPAASCQQPSLVNLIRTRVHFAIRERQRKTKREHALQRGHVRVKKCFGRIALELDYFLFSRAFGQWRIGKPKPPTKAIRVALFILYPDTFG